MYFDLHEVLETTCSLTGTCDQHHILPKLVANVRCLDVLVVFIGTAHFKYKVFLYQGRAGEGDRGGRTESGWGWGLMEVSLQLPSTLGGLYVHARKWANEHA